MNTNVAGKAWFKKAEDDLLWTQANLREKIYYGACFTAHQAIEKSLKAYLLLKRKSVTKIHDLTALIEQCIQIDQSFLPQRENVIPLADYYVQTRYPDMSEFMEYNREKAEDAYKRAKELVDFVKLKLT